MVNADVVSFENTDYDVCDYRVHTLGVKNLFLCLNFVQKQTDAPDTSYGAVTVGLMPSLKQISALSQEGEMTLDTANQVRQPSATPGIVTAYTLYLLYSYCTVLYCTVLYCTVTTVLYSNYCAVLYSNYCAVLYCTVLYCTILYCTLLYSTLLYSTLLYSTGARHGLFTDVI